MNVGERETLSQALELQRVVLASLDAFRGDLMRYVGEFRKEFTDAMAGIDKRLSEVEHAEISRMSEMAGVAKFAASQEMDRKEKSMSRREWARIVVAAAGVGATVASIAWGVIEFLKAPIGV